jgi:hypothetical protein
MSFLAQPYTNTKISFFIYTEPVSFGEEEEFSEEISSQILDLPIKFKHLELLSSKLDYLLNLEDNWDNCGGLAISEEVFLNAYQFLKTIPKKYQDKISPDNITPSSYGTICIDWFNLHNELLSLEIGKTKIGFFTDFISKKNIVQDNIVIEEILHNPQNDLINILKQLY